MSRSDTGEAHRASTPLELLFDLVSVIAIAAAAAGLHLAVAEAPFGVGSDLEDISLASPGEPTPMPSADENAQHAP